mgnify:CR=1 FL=1
MSFQIAQLTVHIPLREIDNNIKPCCKNSFEYPDL